MSSDTPEIASGWQPPRSLQEPLRWGVIGAVAAGGLAIAASLAELLEVPGFEKWGGYLGLVGVVPQVAVLIALVRLGRASSDATDAAVRAKDGLARAAVCLFGLMWLVSVQTVVLDVLDAEQWGLPVLFISFAVSLLILIGLVSHATQGAGVPIVIGTLIAIRYGLGWLLVGKKLPFETALAASTVLVMIGCGLAFPVWFAVALWNRRERLGTAAGVLAMATVAGLIGVLAVLGWAVVTAVRTPNLMDQVDEFDALFKPHVQVGLVVTLLADATAALAAALLFRGVASRIPTEPEPEAFRPGTEEPPTNPELG